MRISLAVAALFAACTAAPPPDPGAQQLPAPSPSDGSDGGSSAAPDAGSSGSNAGGPATGCGALGGGPAGGPADLFPCGHPYYRDISALPVSSASDTIKAAIAAAGGWGNSNTLSVTFDFALLHADAAAPTRTTMISKQSSSDPNDYYPGDSDLLSASTARGWPVPTPPGGRLEDQPGYVCPTDSRGMRTMDCHLNVVDDSRHLLFELYGATFDAASGQWFATQESVWNLAYDYGNANRGLTCTSADASGLPIAAGMIGVREVRDAAATGGVLHHALRLILPPGRVRNAFIAPASHTQSLAYLASGPAFGARFRLRADYDESRIASAGGKVLVRTLKKYGAILVDGGEYALTAETDALVKQKDASLSWSGLLGAFDLAALQVSDFDLVDYDPASVHSPGSNCSVDSTPLRGIPTAAPSGRAAPHRHRVRRGAYGK